MIKDDEEEESHLHLSYTPLRSRYRRFEKGGREIVREGKERSEGRRCPIRLNECEHWNTFSSSFPLFAFHSRDDCKSLSDSKR